jgi:hypothetical protein
MGHPGKAAPAWRELPRQSCDESRLRKETGQASDQANEGGQAGAGSTGNMSVQGHVIRRSGSTRVTQRHQTPTWQNPPHCGAGYRSPYSQAVKALQRERAVDVEEVRRERGRGLGLEELPPAHVGVPFRCRGIRRDRRTRRMVDALTWWPSLSSSPWIRWLPQARSSAASRPISAVICGLTGGRPGLCRRPQRWRPATWGAGSWPARDSSVRCYQPGTEAGRPATANGSCGRSGEGRRR